MDTMDNIVRSMPAKALRFEFFKKYKWSKPLSIMGAILSIIATVVIAQNIKNPLSLRPEAVTGTATIALQPASSTLPPTRTFGVWVTTNQRVGYIRTVVTFDPTKIMITTEPELVLPGFNKVLFTSMADANISGNIILVAGLDPAQRNNSPTGSLRFVNINFGARTNQSNATTMGRINVADSQVVNMDTSSLTLSGSDASITVNPVSATSSPSASPRPSATATSTASARPTTTSTSTSRPTGTPPSTYPNWDVDQNGIINIIDIGLVIDNYGSSNPANPRADVDRSGIVNIIDVGIVIDHYI